MNCFDKNGYLDFGLGEDTNDDANSDRYYHKPVLYMLRVVVILSLLVCLSTKSNSQDTSNTRAQYAYLSLFTSLDFVAGSINYGVEKKRIGYEFGIHYPLFANTVTERSLFGNIGLNLGFY